jgi:hypothetical protein
MKHEITSKDGRELVSSVFINGEQYFGSVTAERAVDIPAWIFAHPNLSDRSVRLWGYLRGALNGSFNLPGTSHVALAELLNVSDVTIRRSIYELRDAGAIAVVPCHVNGKQTKNDYYLWPLNGSVDTETRVITSDQPDHTRTAVNSININEDITMDFGEQNPSGKLRKKRATNTYSEEFAEIWSIYPRPIGKFKAFEEFNRTISEGRGTFAELLQATKNYAEDRAGKSPTYTVHPSTFFSSSERWKAYLSGRAPDVEDYVMPDQDKITAVIYDSYDSDGFWVDPETEEVLFDNPMKHDYTRPVNNQGQLVDQRGIPYSLDSSGQRQRVDY